MMQIYALRSICEVSEWCKVRKHYGTLKFTGYACKYKIADFKKHKWHSSLIVTPSGSMEFCQTVQFFNTIWIIHFFTSCNILCLIYYNVSLPSATDNLIISHGSPRQTKLVLVCCSEINYTNQFINHRKWSA